ncbi:zinc ribbon domain-containing protein [Natribaculum luteum]|uniref:Zinc ribbon domain-containing protein n=1 Tax=Natribaculum luteum TaxID=1586232 RepID=A0ABD5P5L3_9EURY|nr:hypothetical protein [Natribaculum luteum]
MAVGLQLLSVVFVLGAIVALIVSIPVLWGIVEDARKRRRERQTGELEPYELADETGRQSASDDGTRESNQSTRISCRHCSTANDPAYTYCRHCAERL